MKNHIKKFLLLVLLVLGTGSLDSCKKYLDRNPLADIKLTDPYKNFRNFQGFTEELYNCLPLLSANNGHNCWNLGEDEFWEVGEQRLMSYHVDIGDYPAWNQVYYSMFSNNPYVNIADGGVSGKGALWFECWYGIRKCNLGLANLDKMVDATDEEKKLIAGQLYFFRGFYHHCIMEYWGGVPYLDQVYPVDQIIKVPRLSYQACADKVAADMQKAADLLPVDWDATVAGKTTVGNNNQRINKIMALCYMGKSLLWAGSPLMNRESTGNATYNTAYCKKAADAFAQALQIIDATGRYALAPFSQIRDVFYTWNKGGQLPGVNEAILLENLSSATGRFRQNQSSDYRPTSILTTGIKVYPTANYVDYYGMANGLPIPDAEKPDAESGYDPSYPWRNRDPRFYNDIVIDGDRCVQNGGAVGNDEFRVYASLFTGGRFRVFDGTHKVLTGYMSSKIVSKLLNDYDGYHDNNTVVLSLMRLADVYLLYAEATANGYGTPQSTATGYSLTAVDAVNKIRQRAGVGLVAAKFLGNTPDFMSEVRRERAVELAFEGHRFIDLRRWLLLTQRPYTYKKAVEFDRAIPNPQVYADPRNAKVNNFHETVLFERQLVQKHYWFPFTQSDVNMYSEFNQNPGW